MANPIDTATKMQLKMLATHVRRARASKGQHSAAAYTAVAGNRAHRLIHEVVVDENGPQLIDDVKVADAAWFCWLDEAGVDCEQCAMMPLREHRCIKRVVDVVDADAAE